MTISLFNAERLNYGRNYVIIIERKPKGDKLYEDVKTIVKKVKGILYEGCRITEVYRKNRYAYGMRHPDDDMSVPATICPRYPMVNFFGTFVTKELLPITEEAEIIGWEEVK